MKQRALGKGLGALLGEEFDAPTPGQSIAEISVGDIDRYVRQPRKHFDEEKLKELADSIRSHGIVQPIIVKQQGGRYTIIAGERRYRAARLAGLKTVPAVVKNLGDREQMEISLVENLQREDLNPLEEAEAVRMLMDEHGLTQEKVAQSIGRSRSAVANTLRLLNLPEEIKDMLYNNQLTGGHAKALVALADSDMKIRIAREAVSKGLSVRETERLAQKANAPATERAVADVSPEFNDAQDTLSCALGTRVRIVGDDRKGKFIIDYYNREQMESLYEFLCSVSR